MHSAHGNYYERAAHTAAGPFIFLAITDSAFHWSITHTHREWNRRLWLIRVVSSWPEINWLTLHIYIYIGEWYEQIADGTHHTIPHIESVCEREWECESYTNWLVFQNLYRFKHFMTGRLFSSLCLFASSHAAWHCMQAYDMSWTHDMWAGHWALWAETIAFWAMQKWFAGCFCCARNCD